MAKDTWYTTNQMKLFAIKAPPDLLRFLNDGATARDMTKRDFYRSILVSFLPHADKATYLASYKSEDAGTLRFWMDKDIYDYVQQISRKKRVSLSSVCYTAFFNHFQKNQQNIGNTIRSFMANSCLAEYSLAPSAAREGI